MITVLMVVHFLIALLLAGVILLQKSEQGALAGLNGGMGGALSARGAANFLTRGTGILGACFFASSLLLALLFRHAGAPVSLIDDAPQAIILATDVPELPESTATDIDSPTVS